MRDSEPDTESNVSSRRRFLKVAGAAGVVGATGAASLGSTSATRLQDETTTPSEDLPTIKLGGRVEAWQGLAPEDISGTNNPTLNLQPGQVYQLYWLNLDGQPHNIAFQNADGDKLQVLLPLDVSAEEVTITTPGEGTPTEGTPTPTPTEGTPTETTGATATPLEGDLVEKTEIISEQGAVQGVKFVATQEMAQYICLVHPNTMVGDVSLESEM